MQSVAQQQNEITRKELSILFGHQYTNEFQSATYGLSEVHSGTSFILAEAGSPPSRDFIDAVIGAANNSADWFECADAALVRYLWTDRNTAIESKKKRLATQRREFMAWQAEEDHPTLIDCRIGGQSRDPKTGVVINHPTKYRVRIIPLIHLTLDEAKVDTRYNPADPAPAQSRAAARVWKREAPSLEAAPKPRLKRRPPPTDLQTVRVIIGHARRYVGKADDQWDRLQQLHQMLDEAFIEEVPPPETTDSSEVDMGGVVILPPPPPANGQSENGYVSSSYIPNLEPEEVGPQRRDSAPIAPPSVVLDPDPPMPGQKQASEALCVFISRGCRHFFFRLENESRDTVRHQTLTAAEALGALPDWLADADQRHASFMVRPMWTGKAQADLTPDELHADEAEVRSRAIHLDDLDRLRFEMVKPYGALGFESSPDRFQAFIFVTAEKQVADVIKKRLVRSLHSDVGANGAFRLPGSRNWKRTRGGCPVTLHFATFGQAWTPADLEKSGLLAPPDPPSLSSHSSHSSNGANGSNGTRAFPAHQRCIDDAPRQTDGVTPDWSAADLAWANICRDRGISKDAAYSELQRLREALDGKPTRHPSYIRLTIEKAYT